MCCVSTSPFLKAKLTNLVQFNCCVLNAKTIKELLDADTEGAGGLGKHDDVRARHSVVNREGRVRREASSNARGAESAARRSA